MIKNYAPLITEILITLRNINDNLHIVEDELRAVNERLNKPTETQTLKHIVVVKSQEPTKKAKDEENGKIS